MYGVDPFPAVEPDDLETPRRPRDTAETPAVGTAKDNEPAAAKEAAEPPTKKVAAARAIVPGCVHWELTKWPKSEAKPNSHAMRAEILRRDPKARPSGWSNQTCATWLHANAVPPEVVALDAATPRAPEVTREDVADAWAAVDATSTETDPKKKWNHYNCSVRLLHCIVDTKEDFLKRDAKLTRQELDAKSKDWYWTQCALKFNDTTFMPELINSSDPDSAHSYERTRKRS